MGLAAGVVTAAAGASLIERGEQLMSCPAGSGRPGVGSGTSELLSRVSSGVGFSELETEELPFSSSSSSPLPPS